MGTLAQKTVNGQLVFYDSSYAHRWLDAFGPAVNKWLEEFTAANIQAANLLAACVSTLTNCTVAPVVTGQTGTGELVLTTAGADNDGASIQLAGEAFKFSGNLPIYFGCRMKISDATQSDLWLGLCITDTDLTGAFTDGVYFNKADGATTLLCGVRKDSTASTVNIGALDTSYHIYEIYYDGTDIYFYYDGTLVATSVATAANVPSDEYLTPSIEFLAGEAVAKTATIDWVRAIQITAG